MFERVKGSINPLRSQYTKVVFRGQLIVYQYPMPILYGFMVVVVSMAAKLPLVNPTFLGVTYYNAFLKKFSRLYKKLTLIVPKLLYLTISIISVYYAT